MRELSKIKIAISGKSGCGNTTVSHLTAERLNLRFINFTFRSLAEEKGIKLEDVLRLAEHDDYWDREVDRRQIALVRDDENGCVLGSRLAIWLLKNADLKVYLKAGVDARIKRIMKREGGIYEEIMAFTQLRDKQDHERYLHLYNIDTDNYAFADLIVDTEQYSPAEITQLIIDAAEQKIFK